MKIRKSNLLIGTIAVLAVVTWGRAQPQDSSLPPGVAEENWIPISESVGIYVTSLRAGPDKTFFELQELGLQPTIGEIPPTLYGAGVVMARFQGEWVVFEDLAITDPRFHDLK